MTHAMKLAELIEKMCRADCAACQIPPDDFEENENGFRVYNWQQGIERMKTLLTLVQDNDTWSEKAALAASVTDEMAEHLVKTVSRATTVVVIGKERYKATDRADQLIFAHLDALDVALRPARKFITDFPLLCGQIDDPVLNHRSAPVLTLFVNPESDPDE